MAEGLRRRASKWDVVAEPQVPIIQTDAPSMKADEDAVTNSDWNSSKFDASTLSLPSEVKADLVKKNNEKVEEDKSREWPRREDGNVRLPNTSSIQTDAPSMKADEDTVSNSDWNSSNFVASILSLPSEAKADLSKKNNEKVEEDKSRQWPKREDSNVRLPNTSSPSPCFSKLPDIDTGDGDYMKHSYREPLSENHVTVKNRDFNRTGDRWNKSLEQTYGTSLSPRCDGWRQQGPPISPERSWSRSHRSRSRSRSGSGSGSGSRSRSKMRSRSTSRSPSYGFRRGPESSRSRSPLYGSRRGPEKWSGRGRMGGGQAVVCRDFAAGRCQRGSECKFLHVDTGRRPSNRYYDSGTSNTRESRAERGKLSGQGIRENFTESREQSDYSWDRFSRNDRRTTRCYNFTMGRCQRGSECRYAHDDVSHDSGWGARDESRARTRDGRDVDSPRRGVGDTPCKFFAVGRCSRGEACRFSHRVVGSHDDRSGYNMAIDTSNSSWRGQNQGYQPVVIDTSNSSWNGQNQGDQPVVIDTFNPSPWTVDDNDSMTDDPRLKPQYSQSEVPEVNINQIQPQEANNPLAVASVPGQTFGQGGLDQYIASQPIQTLPFTPNVQIQQLVPPMPFNGQIQPAIFSLPQNGQGQFIAPQVPSINVPMQNLPFLPPSHIGLSQQNYNLPPPSHSGQNQPNFNLSRQIQQNVPLLNGQNQPSLNFAGQSHQTLPPPQDVQNQNVVSQPPNPESLSLHEQLMQRADTSEKQPSQLNSDTPIAPKVVTSEQAAQITNLSASLARFFGSASALNPQIATGLMPLVQPDQGSFTQQQANLISGNMEPMNLDANNFPPGFEQKDPAIQEAQTNIDGSVPLSVIVGTNYGNPLTKSVDLEVKVQGNEGTAAKEVNETENIHSKKEQAEDVESDGRENGDGKQSKDVKAMRMFKCALVDFVKDALKPSWKEGHLSKEAHKTIVKKVVDKVTGAMQSQSIPQTQDKIDIYMSHSKGKLTKLVQAYVEKFV